MDEILAYEPHVFLHRYIIVTASEISYYQIWDTVFDSHSIREEFAANSFEIVGIYGDVCGKEYTPESRTMAILCRKKDSDDRNG